ncbi:MAG: ABC transporter ATP-binding protein [Parcubacteria group bacterium]
MSDIAIKVKDISKTFRIPHEKITSLRGAAISAFKKKTYEEFKALDGVSFEVKKGEFFGIIGRNGSGKSTFLKILASIYKPDKGKLKIDGMISPFLELGIGFNPELSGRDNVYLNATVLGMTKKQIDEKFDDIIKFSELERFVDQKLKNYSSGMSVRLAFSVSIHANRDILLMDEVLAVGDANFQKKCIDIFKDYHAKGKTVILVTHDISSVRRYCSRALLLHDGKIVKIGDVNDVCDAYIIKNVTADARKELLENEKMQKIEDEREAELSSKNKKQS